MTANTPDHLQSRYWYDLVHGLAKEVRAGCSTPPSATILRKADELLNQVVMRPISSRYQEVAEAYRTLSTLWGNILAEKEVIANEYKTMDDFWSALNLQRAGKDPGTIWDSYEHGRRRQLERTISRTTGTEDAVLLNSGMSAVTVALESFKPSSGTRILVGKKQYFETNEFVEDVLSSRGCKVKRVDFSDPSSVMESMVNFRPDIVLYEVVSNTIELYGSEGVTTDVMDEFPDTIFIADNTMFSTLDLLWGGRPFPSNLVIVESGTKYVARGVMTGIIYGPLALVDIARKTARGLGQQLSGRCSCYIRPNEIAKVPDRLRLHSRNVGVFLSELNFNNSPFQINVPIFKRRDQKHASVGGLIYISLADEINLDVASIFRMIMEDWNARIYHLELSVPVRAGFGWDETSFRIYETSGLNQTNAPNYVRISVGIEPETATRQKAAALRISLEEAHERIF
jgi:cystathionine beta-lyase/cystathionine gamma-synthase